MPLFLACIDILIVAALVYLGLIFMRETKTYFALNSIVALVILNGLSIVFGFRLTHIVLSPLLTGLAIIAAIVFQAEIRRFFRFVASGKGLGFATLPAKPDSLRAIAESVVEMADKSIGALIIFPGESGVDDVVEGGFTLDGKISRPLILSIFDSNSPGHDGAILIDGNRIKKFGLHLPLAENFKSFAKVGTRHRAGAGITEKTDALAIIVSEERGTVSVAENGVLREVRKEDVLEVLRDFSKELREDSIGSPSFWHYLAFRNVGEKAISLCISVLLWLLLVYR